MSVHLLERAVFGGRALLASLLERPDEELDKLLVVRWGKDERPELDYANLSLEERCYLLRLLGADLDRDMDA